VEPKIYPALRFRDAEAGRRWLVDAFGFNEHEVVRDAAGDIVHAELKLGDDIVMFGSGDPAKTGVYIAVDDVDRSYERVRAAGAEIVRELEETDYGSREFTVRDADGYEWSVGTYRP
jgi:uncharacterized glyoxalase superfamily protein PhnB